MGIVFAGFGLRVLLAAMPCALPCSENIGLHPPVLLFTLLTSTLVGILFSLVPALQSARPDIQAAMRQNVRGTTVGRKVLLSRRVTEQFALTLVLITCAGLLLRSIRNLSPVNLLPRPKSGGADAFGRPLGRGPHRGCGWACPALGTGRSGHLQLAPDIHPRVSVAGFNDDRFLS